MLTDLQCRAASPEAKPRKLFDGGGLFLLVHPNGGKYWRWKFRHAGREQLLSLGTFPALSLKEARLKRDAERLRLASGINPALARRAEKLRVTQAAGDTFAAIYEEFLQVKGSDKSPATLQRWRFVMGGYVLRWLGSIPIAQIDAATVLAMLKKIEARGLNETAHRARMLVSATFRYAIATQRAKYDPTMDLRGALAPVRATSHAAVTDPAAIGELLRAIDALNGFPPVLFAMRLAPLTFVRPGELRRAEWSEIDWTAAEWRIPASKMKMREAHIVPLARQSLDLLRELHPITGGGRYLFPSARGDGRPMSENTVTAALRRLGYSGDTMTGHGFRTMASTRLNELGFPPDVIERQLAHAERNKVRAAYNRAQYMPERRKMMQAWADHLDRLRKGATGATRARSAAGDDHGEC